MTDRPSDLKPCPFCGGPATVYRAICHPSAFVAECASLDEEGSDGWFCAVRPKIRSDRGKEAAIERWNTRAPASPPEPTTNPPEIGSKSVVEPTAEPIPISPDDLWTCPLPEHWRRAIEERGIENPKALDWIEQRARQMAKAGGDRG